MNTYLLLGRTGDICSVLPFMKQETERPRLVVSNQHSNLLEGVSYVETVEWPQGIHLLREAYDWATKQFGTVKSLQVIGNAEVVRDVTYRPAGAESARATSFVKEMWRCAGVLNRWDEVLPLVFDKRSQEREAALIEKYIPKKPGKPRRIILVFTESHSSPFQYRKLLEDLIQWSFLKSWTVVLNPKADRLFDLLALYEKAHTVICVDSAPLHLTRAVPSVPVYALTNDKPSLWNGSPWMPNHAWYCRYSDFPNRTVEMVDCIDQSCWNYDSNEVVRLALCDKGFSLGPSLVEIREGMAGRDSQTSLGDQKRFPYLKDCIRMGMQRTSSDGHLAVTVQDAHFYAESWRTTSKHSPCFAYRIQKSKDGTLTFVPVVDLFVASKSWWKQRLPEIPDYILGKDHYWRNGLWALFKKHHARDLTGICTRATPEA